jgi:SAM-dependent methyltransferase
MSVRVAARAVLRKAVPQRYRGRLRQLFNSATAWAYAGGRLFCPCCEGTFRRFRVYVTESGRRENLCPRCGSLGRHRVDWLFLRQRGLLRPPNGRLRLLHVAPEPAFQRRLAADPNIDYVSGDLDSAFAMERLDVTEIGHGDGSFDAVICNHVLEHVPDDARALHELHRILARGGWAMLQVPLDASAERTREDPSITDPEERRRQFWQHDHVRLYGRDYAERLEAAGFDVTVEAFTEALPADEIERQRLDRDERIYLARKP